ncbi:hypothetical protein ABIB48_002622 [Arthrobacter sp. UYCu511]|uniref:hypothetical protein n=1 Tax=Arthrobacter sp. UYCu511 TaxID=3156337 RepID=UPI0033962C92
MKYTNRQTGEILDLEPLNTEKQRAQSRRVGRKYRRRYTIHLDEPTAIALAIGAVILLIMAS